MAKFHILKTQTKSDANANVMYDSMRIELYLEFGKESYLLGRNLLGRKGVNSRKNGA